MIAYACNARKYIHNLYEQVAKRIANILNIDILHKNNKRNLLKYTEDTK